VIILLLVGLTMMLGTNMQAVLGVYQFWDHLVFETFLSKILGLKSPAALVNLTATYLVFSALLATVMTVLMLPRLTLQAYITEQLEADLATANEEER
jgi:hypothetical protein